MRINSLVVVLGIFVGALAFCQKASAHFNPSLGRWMQREPTEAAYVDGADLYQALDSNPVGLVDPDGTDPRFGVWSGINSNGTNYIGKWWGPPFTPEGDLSGMSGLTTWTTGPWPFAQPNLNREAQGVNSSPQTCGNIEVLMIEPATSAGSPVSSCSCCHVHATLLFNPYDQALAIAGFPNDLPSRNQQMNGWGQAIPIS
jgi:hypothetical protein